MIEKAAHAAASSDVSTYDPTVYVVDDDTAILDLIRRVCVGLGRRVETFTSGQAFLEVLSSDRQGCVLLDYMLPELSGLQLLKELNARDVMLPVVFISGHAEVSTAVEAFKHGTMDFLEKPFTVEELQTVIEQAIELDRQAREERAHFDEVDHRIHTLTPRENQVMGLVVEGHSNKLIASELGVSPKTVEVHRANVMTKMKAGSLAELVRMAIAHRTGRERWSDEAAS